MTMKKEKDRMMTPDQAVTKMPKALIAINERTINGYGTFAIGDEITDPTLIEFLMAHGEHPDFKIKEA